MARAGMVLEAARMLTYEPLPPARSLAEGDAEMILMLLASLFRARHGLQAAAADHEGQMTQFAQWLEEYDVQVTPTEQGDGKLPDISLASPLCARAICLQAICARAVPHITGSYSLDCM